MSILTKIGLFIALGGLYEVALFVWVYLWRASSIGSYLPTKDGKKPWAMVVNASDGIGKGFADKLAELGFNIVLHDRDPYKLARVRAQLEQTYPTAEFRTIIANWQLCANGYLTSFPEIKTAVRDINLKILINSPYNDGSDYSLVDQRSPRQIAERITALAIFPVQVASILIGELARNGPGLVMNIVSKPDLGMPTRASSMSFLASSTVELALESRAMGREVEVLGIRAGAVAANSMEESLWCPSVETFVEAALAKVGCGQTLVVPYWTHVLQGWAAKLLPEFVSEAMSVAMMKDRYGKNE